MILGWLAIGEPRRREDGVDDCFIELFELDYVSEVFQVDGPVKYKVSDSLEAFVNHLKSVKMTNTLITIDISASVIEELSYKGLHVFPVMRNSTEADVLSEGSWWHNQPTRVLAANRAVASHLYRCFPRERFAMLRSREEVNRRRSISAVFRERMGIPWMGALVGIVIGHLEEPTSFFEQMDRMIAEWDNVAFLLVFATSGQSEVAAFNHWFATLKPRRIEKIYSWVSTNFDKRGSRVVDALIRPVLGSHPSTRNAESIVLKERPTVPTSDICEKRFAVELDELLKTELCLTTGGHGVRPVCLWSLTWATSKAVLAPVQDCEQDRVLFITNNLSQGGAQRSLINLLHYLNKPVNCMLTTLSEISTKKRNELSASGVLYSHLGTSASKTKWMEWLLLQIVTHQLSTLVFWNMDAAYKVLITETIGHLPIRIIDVSPGPKMFRSLDREYLQDAQSNGVADNYYRDIDRLVVKYASATLPAYFNDNRDKVDTIPNGVYINEGNAQTKYTLRGDPRYSIVSAIRITPAKMVEELLHVMVLVKEAIPTASLTIFGGRDDQNNPDYWRNIVQVHKDLDLRGTVYFEGQRSDVRELLSCFKSFLMLSVDQGCPNASLEAMAAGLPVVANPDGGTAEQVLDGLTGFLVPETDICGIAEKVIWLLRNPDQAFVMGQKGRQHAKDNFSMNRMAKRYSELLWPSQ